MDTGGFRGLGRALVLFLVVCCLIAFAFGAGVVFLITKVLT